jgi:hypothetical protein
LRGPCCFWLRTRNRYSMPVQIWDRNQIVGLQYQLRTNIHFQLAEQNEGRQKKGRSAVRHKDLKRVDGLRIADSGRFFGFDKVHI